MPKTGKIGKDFEGTKEVVLDFIHANSGVTIRDIAPHIGVSYQAVYRYTNALIKEGLICKCAIRVERKTPGKDSFKYFSGFLAEV